MFPTNVVKNQFGEESNNFLIGGSNQIDINFVVDHSNGNGLGIRSLKGSPLVSAVYMNTSASPAVGNPNPLAGFVLVQFAEAFQGYVSGFAGFVSPLSGTPVNVTSGLTLHQPYVIVSVGTTTPAQWQTLGLPSNIVPAVGVSFIAKTASAGSGTGVVETPSASGILEVEVVGDPNTTLNPATGGGYVLSQFLAPTINTGAYVTPIIPTAPADGSVCGLRFSLLSPTAGPIN